MKKQIKNIAVCALAAGLAVAAGVAGAIDVKSAAAAGQVEVDPYIAYEFTSADTLYQNTGSSASENAEKYKLNKLGNGKESDMCFSSQLNLEDNGAVYLRGDDNPFANGDLTDFTVAFKMNALYGSWFASPLSWDSFSGDPDNADTNDGNFGGHQYTRISTAWKSSNADWFRFTDSQAMELNAAHWNSYGNGATLYTGDRTQTDSKFTTIVLSVDADSLMTVKAYMGRTEVGSLTYDLTGKDWSTYLANATTKQFTIGCAWDSRNGGKMEMKTYGRIDYVRIYDFAMTDTQIAQYAQDEKVAVDGVEIDSEIDGGTVTADNYLPAVGEEVTFTVTPEANSALSQITVNGEVIEPVGGVYKATMVEGGLFVSAEFVRTLPVNLPSNSVGGTVTADKSVAKEGETVTFTVTVNNGYVLKALLVNGAPLTPVDGVYSAEMPVGTEGMTVTADFVKTVTITVADGIKNGTLSVTKTTYNEGDTVIVTAKPDEGYEIKEITVNGEKLEKAGGFYSFKAQEDATVNVVFQKIGAAEGGAGVAGCSGSLQYAAWAFVPVVLCAAMIFLKKRKEGEK